MTNDNQILGFEPAKLTKRLVAGASCILLLSILASLMLGPVSIRPDRILFEILDRIPGISIDSGLSQVEAAIIWDILTGESKSANA